MKDRIIEMLVVMAHISKQMQSLSEEIDKLFDLMANDEFLKTLNK